MICTINNIIMLIKTQSMHFIINSWNSSKLIIPSLSWSTLFNVLLNTASINLFGVKTNAFIIFCVFKVPVFSLSKNLKAYFK